MHRLRPTPEKQTGQGLRSRTKSEGNVSSDVGPHRDSEAFPAGCPAGKVKGALDYGGLCRFYPRRGALFSSVRTAGRLDFTIKSGTWKLICWVFHIIGDVGASQKPVSPPREPWGHPSWPSSSIQGWSPALVGVLGKVGEGALGDSDLHRACTFPRPSYKDLKYLRF